MATMLVARNRPSAPHSDDLAEDMTGPAIIDHYPQLTTEDIHTSLAYAAELAHESVWKTGTNA